MVHGRRAKPGGEGGGGRYFVDVSYCQPGENQWPAYGRHGEIFGAALRLGHDRGGAFRDVFDMGIFYADEEGYQASRASSEAKTKETV